MSEEFKATKNGRGFVTIKFTDSYREECSIQESSLVVPHLWVGIDDPDIKILTADGWKDYPLVEGALVSGRMHLNKEKVMKLSEVLNEWLASESLEKYLKLEKQNER